TPPIHGKVRAKKTRVPRQSHDPIIEQSSDVMEDIIEFPPVFEVPTATLIDMMDTSESYNEPQENHRLARIQEDLKEVDWSLYTNQSSKQQLAHATDPMSIDDTTAILDKIS